MHLVCRSDHRLAEQAEVNLRQLANERFVEVPPGWTARLLSDAGFAGEGIPRRIACEVGDWELFLELVSAGVGIGFAPVGLQYPVLTAPDSVLRLIAVAGVHLERHIYLILPSPGETSPAAQRFAEPATAHPHRWQRGVRHARLTAAFAHPDSEARGVLSTSRPSAAMTT